MTELGNENAAAAYEASLQHWQPISLQGKLGAEDVIASERTIVADTISGFSTEVVRVDGFGTFVLAGTHSADMKANLLSQGYLVTPTLEAFPPVPDDFQSPEKIVQSWMPMTQALRPENARVWQ